MSRIITLTTDFGLKDGYVGVMKGVILARSPRSRIVDLSHDIPPGDLRAAALVLLTSWKYFPRKSVHVVVVDPGVGPSHLRFDFLELLPVGAETNWNNFCSRTYLRLAAGSEQRLSARGICYQSGVNASQRCLRQELQSQCRPELALFEISSMSAVDALVDEDL